MQIHGYGSKTCMDRYAMDRYAVIWTYGTKELRK